MKKRGIALVLGLVAGSVALQAQTTLIPFDKLERESQPQLQRGSDLIATATDGSSSSSVIPAAAILNTRRTPAIIPPVVDNKFVLFNAFDLGMALFDVGMTQRCISNHQCKEGNPLMPSSIGGQLGVSLGMFAYATGTSYFLKKHRSRSWWTPPVAGSVTHAVGVMSGFVH